MLWEAWKLSQAYRTRPSDLYAIRDEVRAWSFDRAVYLFGSQLEAELETAGQEAKSKAQARSARQRVLSRWLGVEQKFRDPAVGKGGTVSSTSGGTVAL